MTPAEREAEQFEHPDPFHDPNTAPEAGGPETGGPLSSPEPESEPETPPTPPTQPPGGGATTQGPE